MSFCVKKLSVIFIIKKIFKQQLKQQTTKVRQWDIKIYSPLKLLLKVLIWYKYKNEIVKHITMMESNNWIFLLKVHIKTYNLSKKNDVLVIHSFYFLCRKKTFYKKRENPNCLFDKSHTQEIVKCHILHEQRWLRWIIIEHVKFERGIIIRTAITCKKIPCYMRDSACRWFIVQRAKIFEVMLTVFHYSRVCENVQFWLVYANKFFWISFFQPYFSTDIIS